MFQELGLLQPILRAIEEEGYTVPTPIQAQAIPHLVRGHDLLGCAQTGTGKTAAFALPLLHRLAECQTTDARATNDVRPIHALVLSPTRELAAQIGASFLAYGRYTNLRHAVVFGGVNQRPQVDLLRRGIDILVATPGRLLDLMNQGYVNLTRVKTFVLDEADRMLDMGFLPDVKRIIAKLPVQRQTILCSATMPPAIDSLANSILQHPMRIRIAPEKPAAELVEQSVCFVPRNQKTKVLSAYLTTQSVSRAIVFTRTKHHADRVSKDLNRAGIRAEALHGDKTQAARERTFANFKSSRTPILVATDIAARGIDVDGISHIVNFNIPSEPETYVHRIGRTGRAGMSGIAISFCDEEERQFLNQIERLLRKKLLVERHVATLQPSATGVSTSGASTSTPSPALAENQRPENQRPKEPWQPARKSSRSGRRNRGRFKSAPTAAWQNSSRRRKPLSKAVRQLAKTV